MSICNSFIFTVRNSIIKDTNKKLLLNEIFQQIKEEKKIFSSTFIKSCLFLFNNDQNQGNIEEDLQRAKNDIKELILVQYNINLCIFNAMRYCNYINNYQYFFNLENTIAKEFKEYSKINNDIFKNPDPNTQRKYNSFLNYLDNAVRSRISNKNIDDLKKDEKVEGILAEILKKLEIDIKSNAKDQEKITKIAKCFSFGREKIKNSETKKESNYDFFKENLNFIIHNVNADIQEGIKQSIDNILKSLDSFFSFDFHKGKNDEEIKNFESKIRKINEKINAVSENNQKYYLETIDKYKEIMKKLLNKKKENIIFYLQEKKYTEIIEEINEQIENNLKDLNNKVIELLEKFNDTMNKIISESNFIINKFFGGNGNDLDIPQFLDFFSSNLRVKKIDLTKEIIEEIHIIFSSSRIIYEKKGFKSWIISAFSNQYYLENIIDIILSTLLSKFEYILILFLDNIYQYIPILVRSISKKQLLATTKFTEQYKKILTELIDDYNEAKVEIDTIRKSEKE
jgi:hypothetical protein